MNDFDFRFQWRGSENQQLQKKRRKKNHQNQSPDWTDSLDRSTRQQWNAEFFVGPSILNGI